MYVRWYFVCETAKIVRFSPAHDALPRCRRLVPPCYDPEEVEEAENTDGRELVVPSMHSEGAGEAGGGEGEEGGGGSGR